MSFILDNLPILLGYLFGAGGFFAFLFERKKNKAVTQGVVADANEKEIDNGGKVVDLYKNALDDLENRYEKKYNEITALFDRKIKVLEDEIKLKNKFISSLKRELRERDIEIKKLKEAAENDGNSTK
jgi:hypothetical protein